jgi:hypothetical protein
MNSVSNYELEVLVCEVTTEAPPQHYCRYEDSLCQSLRNLIRARHFVVPLDLSMMVNNIGAEDGLTHGMEVMLK